MNNRILPLLSALALLAIPAATPADSLIPNPSLEDGVDAPTDWPAAAPDKGLTYETEDGNRFLRIHSDGGTAMRCAPAAKRRSPPFPAGLPNVSKTSAVFGAAGRST